MHDKQHQAAALNIFIVMLLLDFIWKKKRFALFSSSVLFCSSRGGCFYRLHANNTQTRSKYFAYVSNVKLGTRINVQWWNILVDVCISARGNCSSTPCFVFHFLYTISDAKRAWRMNEKRTPYSILLTANFREKYSTNMTHSVQRKDSTSENSDHNYHTRYGHKNEPTI